MLVRVALALLVLGSLVATAASSPRAAEPGPRDTHACEDAVTQYLKLLAQPPLAAPWHRICTTDELQRLAGTWGIQNLTVSESGHSAPDPNAGPNSSAPSPATTLDVAVFTFTWRAPCPGGAGDCGFSEWWTADLRTGAVVGPLAAHGPWQPAVHGSLALVTPPTAASP